MFHEHTPTARRRRRVPMASLVAVALMVTAASAQTDDFFDSNLDGVWVGSLTSAGSRFPVQMNLNAQGTGGFGSVVIGQFTGSELTGVVVTAATLSGVSANAASVTFDDSNPLSRSFGTTTAKLKYKASAATLSGKTTGAFKGKILLARVGSSVPAQKLWAGTVKVAGKSRMLVLALTESGGANGRFTASSIGGFGWLGDEVGTIVNGTRNGGKITGTVDLAEDLSLNLSLKKKNRLLKGTANQGGAKIKVALKPAGTAGKKVKVKTASPGEVSAGTTTSVTLSTKNTDAGATVHTDRADVQIGSVSVASKSIVVQITTDSAVADGTQFGLRVVNVDGQVVDKTNLLTVTGSDGGGGGGTISFASQIQPIFDQNCALAGCHAQGSGAGGLVLASGLAFGNLVNVPSSEQPSLFRINPGNPDDSYLVRKIRGEPTISGGRMPLNRTPLDDSTIELIVTWVNEGARNNRTGR